MAELSIFCDESGDFGEGLGHYILTLVFHDQRHQIDSAVEWLAAAQRANGLDSEHAIHTGPAIRGENEYHNAGIEKRRREFNLLYSFARAVPVTFKTFDYLKREYPDRLKLKGAISRDLGRFLMENSTYFLSFDKVLIYYDNGQAEITDMLNTILNALLRKYSFP